MPTRRWCRSTSRPSAALSRRGERTVGDRYLRAKLERLAGDSLRRAGQDKAAAAQYLDSLRTWASLGERKDLPRSVVAERELDTSRAMWWLGDPGKAIDLAMQALEHDPESEELATNAVAFLLEIGRYRDALAA